MIQDCARKKYHSESAIGVTGNQKIVNVLMKYTGQLNKKVVSKKQLKLLVKQVISIKLSKNHIFYKNSNNF